MRASDIIKMQMNQAFRNDAKQSGAYVPYKYREMPQNITSYNNTQKATTICTANTQKTTSNICGGDNASSLVKLALSDASGIAVPSSVHTELRMREMFYKCTDCSGGPTTTTFQNKTQAKAVCTENKVYTNVGADMASSLVRPVLPDASGRAVPASVITELRARELRTPDMDCSNNTTSKYFSSNDATKALCNADMVATTFGGKNASDMRYIKMAVDSSGKMVQYIQYPNYKDISGRAVPSSVLTEKYALEIAKACLKDNNTDVSCGVVRPTTTYYNNRTPVKSVISDYDINASHATVDCNYLNIYDYINFDDAKTVHNAVKITPINYNAVVDCSGQCTQGT